MFYDQLFNDSTNEFIIACYRHLDFKLVNYYSLID